MANPQPTDAHIRIAHSITEEIMMRDFTKRQRSIMDFILRLSWGCGKKIAIIPLQKDFELVGIDKTKIKAEISWLINAKVISRDQSGKEYSFNKNFDEWRVSIVPNYDKKRFIELLNLNLRSCQNGNLNSDKVAKTATIQLGKVDEKATDELTKKQLLLHANATDASVRDLPKESILKKDIYIDDFFESVWKLYPHKKGKGQVSKSQKAKLYKIGYEHLKRCIDRYKENKPDWQQWQHGSTFFNSGYVDYLDENSQSQVETIKPNEEYLRVKESLGNASSGV